MKQLALKISNEFLKKNIISEKDIEIYRYGLEILISSTFTSLSVIMVAALLDSFGYGILYLFLTIPIRVTASGYHADTYKKCFFISNVSYIALSCVFKILQQSNLPVYLWLIILYLSTAYIC